jgi:hypothetical protein
MKLHMRNIKPGEGTCNQAKFHAEGFAVIFFI